MHNLHLQIVKRILPFILTLMCLSLSWVSPVKGASVQSISSTPFSARGGLPLLFVAESDLTTIFSAAGLGGQLAFLPGSVVLSLPDGEGMQVRFLDANPVPELTPSEQQPTRINRYLGSHQARWQTNLPTYAALTYQELYPGVALRYEGQDGQLKGTFHILPGGDPSSIRWRYEGAQAVAIEPESGDLQILLPSGRLLSESAPIAWQVLDGRQVPVPVRFSLEGDRAGFILGAYDPSLRLIIDPTLTYSTFLGGISSDFIRDISLDSSANIYVGGWTYTNNLGGIANTVSGYNDAFVAKLNAAGTAWQWVTYLGGSDHEQGYGLAAGSGGIWLTGYTDSPDFPTTANAYQSDFGGYYDVILARLDPASGALTYSSYYGFDNLDEGRDVVLDGSGNAYFTGQINQADLLVMKLTAGADPDLAYSVMWGDDYGEDTGYALAVDGAGQVFVTGKTEGAPSGVSTFPIVDGLQTSCGPYTYAGGSTSCTTDAFVSVLNAAGTDLVYSTLLGGSGSPEDGSGTDEGRGIAIDPQGNIYVTGLTYAADFPIANAAYPNYPDPSNKADAWVTKLSPDGQTMIYSTYLGADDDDQARSILSDSEGNAYVLGFTRSSNFPVLSAIQTKLGEGGVCFSGSTVRACYDSFLTKLTANGSLAWSTYLGDAWDEYGYGLARQANGTLYLAGVTNSPGYPTTVGAVQQDWGGNEDGFITKIADSSSGGGVTPGKFNMYLPILRR